MVFIDYVYYFHRCPLNKVAAFDFFNGLSESAGRTFSLVTYRDDSNTEGTAFLLNLLFDICLLLFPADDHDREVKPGSLDEVRQVTVHLDMKAEVLKHRDMLLQSERVGVEVDLGDGQDRLGQLFEYHDFIDDFLEVIGDKEHLRIILLLRNEITIANDLALHAQSYGLPVELVVNYQQWTGSFRCLELLEAVVELICDVFDLKCFFEDEKLWLCFAFEVLEDANIDLIVLNLYCFWDHFVSLFYCLR